jgi:hypothetical protein
MFQEFVSYDVALELKKLGFANNCLAYYTELGDLFPIDTDFINFRDINEKYVKAPLFQQVFDWFRVVHNLPSGIFPDMTNHKAKKIYTYMFSITIWERERVGGYAIDTFEEARKLCLEKLIELIEEELNEN